MLLVDFQLPFRDPVLVFFVIASVLLLVPWFFGKMKLPGVVGLILAGTLVGPHGLNLIQRTDTTLFGTVGLLYILFIAGLEIDLEDFQKNSRKSLAFGAATFLIPLISGTIVCFYLLDYSLTASLIIAVMFSTHTLIAYPMVSQFGLARNQAVTITVGGTMVTDIAALLILTLVIEASEHELTWLFWVKTLLSFAGFTAVVLYTFPLISRWFFRNVGRELVVQYLFVVVMLFLAAVLAELAGLEAIIGAFLAGLALNRQIPERSPLFSNISFVGNSIFIPFFLIGIGMLVDLSIIWENPLIITVFLTLITVALGSKYLAAWLTQRIYGYSRVQRHVIFGLSSAHAAATMAIILAAYNLGLVDAGVLNATILLILFTCLVSSLVTDRAARRLVVESPPETNWNKYSERTLIPVANPSTMKNLVELGRSLNETHSAIYPLSIVFDDDQASEEIIRQKQVFHQQLEQFSFANVELEPVVRVDVNASNGIIRSSKELEITNLVIGWNARLSARNWLFGSVLDNLLELATPQIWVARLVEGFQFDGQVQVVIPSSFAQEPSLNHLWKNTRHLLRQLNRRVVIHASEEVMNRIDDQPGTKKIQSIRKIRQLDTWYGLKRSMAEVGSGDLTLIFCARRSGVAYAGYLKNLPGFLATNYADHQFILVFPALNYEEPVE
jgi:Kef-type K+ transport system membrane component KefB